MNALFKTAVSLLFAWAVSVAGALDYSNPVLRGDFPDPSVIRVGDEYWATATTSEWAPLFPLLHSRDLIHWEITGAAFPRRPEWSVGNYWAPEISEHKGTFYIYYVGRKTNGPLSVAVATAPKPGGPYTDHGPMISQPAGSIDPVPCLDEHGRRYLIWKEDGNSRRQPTVIWAQPLSEDGTQLTGEMKELIRNDAPWEANVVEGPFVLRRGQWFYLFYSGNACCGRRCNYALGVARAKALLGPWEKNPANPILTANERWKCPGHGSIVSDVEGHDYLLYHAYEANDFVYVGRQGLLDEITWPTSGATGSAPWPILNQAHGPSSGSRRAESPGFFDSFESGTALRPEWQWPQANEPVVRLAKATRLFLAPNPRHTNDPIGAVLAVHTTTGDYVATASIETAGLDGNASGGLAAFGDQQNALGVTVSRGEARLWRRQRNEEQILATNTVPSTGEIFLRFTASAGHRFHFVQSTDQRNWTALGPDLDLEGEFLPPWDRGVRVALVAGGRGATFRWMRLENRSAR